MHGLVVCRAIARAAHAAGAPPQCIRPRLAARAILCVGAADTRPRNRLRNRQECDLPELFPIAAEERRSFRMNFKDPNVHLTFS